LPWSIRHLDTNRLSIAYFDLKDGPASFTSERGVAVYVIQNIRGRVRHVEIAERAWTAFALRLIRFLALWARHAHGIISTHDSPHSRLASNIFRWNILLIFSRIASSKQGNSQKDVGITQCLHP
jgi:hypothetical protein